MNTNDIETFLMVAMSKNLNTAAEKMYLSQSTISSRIKSLEDELGTQLFYRSRGKKTVTLTTRGEEFLSYAQDFSMVHANIQDWLNHATREQLNLASLESLNNTLFNDLYVEVVQDRSIYIEVSTMQNDQIIDALMSKKIDLGIMTHSFNSKAIRSKTIFREDMVVVSLSSLPQLVDVKTMDATLEVYFDWGPSYAEWHNLWFNPNQAPLIRVDSSKLIFDALKIDGAWAVVPISVALHFFTRESVNIARLSVFPPNRECHLLYLRDCKPSKLQSINTFENHLERFIEKNKFLHKVQ